MLWEEWNTERLSQGEARKDNLKKKKEGQRKQTEKKPGNAYAMAVVHL